MTKFLRRKPKAPMTPRQRYKDDLTSLFGLGMAATFGGAMVAIVVKAALDGGVCTAADMGVAIVLAVVGIGAVAWSLVKFRRITKRLMDHAPADDQSVGVAVDDVRLASSDPRDRFTPEERLQAHRETGSMETEA